VGFTGLRQTTQGNC